MAIYDIVDFGAVGDGRADDTAAVQQTVDGCADEGGGTVLVRAGGVYQVSTVTLRSNVTFHVEAGATLIASPEADASRSAVLQADGAENVAITGQGVIDGRSPAFVDEKGAQIYTVKRHRPRVLLLTDCTHVRIRDVTLRETPSWALTAAGCEDVVIHGITIDNDLRMPNSDGIDVDSCRNVRISDCHISSGDDCVCIKSSGRFTGIEPCERITVTGCTLTSTSCAIKIGSESIGDIRNIVFDACVVTGSNRGLGIQNRDAGVVENVVFSNIVVGTRLFGGGWWGQAEPIYVTSFPREVGGEVGRVRNVRFSHILCHGESGVYLAGTPEVPLESIRLDDVRVEIEKLTDHPGGRYDRRPGAGQAVVEQTVAGVTCEHANHVTLRDVEVVWAGAMPEGYGPALSHHHVNDLRLDGFRGDDARS